MTIDPKIKQLIVYLDNNNYDGLTDKVSCACEDTCLGIWCNFKYCLECTPGHIIITGPDESDWDIIVD